MGRILEEGFFRIYGVWVLHAIIRQVIEEERKLVVDVGFYLGLIWNKVNQILVRLELLLKDWI